MVDMKKPFDLFAESVLNDSVVKFEDGSARIWWGNRPLGGKIQTPGPRCRRWRHDWYIEKYDGCRGEYADKVCRTCKRRRPLNV
ncbi:hypothetical protein LITTLEE_27 [Mycobacterium phage LittleE]|uniref:Uncharacterized protein n=4 Tax=Omegavirus TaxID=1623292 RepID=Q854N5_BPMOM|nr:gp29 [Mycobacterium phage Omega]YP_009011926.1 hypothetical protein CM09_gp027 [Mycobacterium phage Courthouse]YP_009213244.1 hypothetical protein AVV70_gp027 [Mycobacterium phage MiaZeal]YP_009636938.1 hypothetical protein FGG27_gp027 [Mycobacterium phage LittleE]ASD53420.1 hypothetical protein PBI_LUCKY2013_27 [Mycobacterium phage Lucky2013]ASZ74102.1 hypothetical protein SEA_SQUINT_26 [Mycobacterium phage Squint]QGJ93666.1 hypothetical protein SEA_HANNACONDA_24 [Mycobacterium phage Hann